MDENSRKEARKRTNPFPCDSYIFLNQPRDLFFRIDGDLLFYESLRRDAAPPDHCSRKGPVIDSVPTAGRTPGFEQSLSDLLIPGDAEDLSGAGSEF